MTDTATEPLWDSILRRAAAEREKVRTGHTTVHRGDLGVELTPFGMVRWYLHNDLDAPVTRALYFFELEIPAGSRSGLLRHQGGIVHLVVAGSGYTEYDGGRHEWTKRDVIAMPVRPEGVTFRHVNDGTGPARMVVAWPNLDSALGAEAGVAMDVLEPAPEYAAVSR